MYTFHSIIWVTDSKLKATQLRRLILAVTGVSGFLQAQAASQDSLEQLRDSNHASLRSQMELRIQDLESELSKLRAAQQDSSKTELEKYKQFYLEELKVRHSLSAELNK